MAAPTLTEPSATGDGTLPARDVMQSYRVTDLERSLRGNLAYGLSTSLGLVGLVTAMLSGLLGGVVAIALGAAVVGAVAVGLVTGVVVLALLVGSAWRAVLRAIANFDVRFPTPPGDGQA